MCALCEKIRKKGKERKRLVVQKDKRSRRRKHKEIVKVVSHEHEMMKGECKLEK
jgi:hypothetical protein